MSCHHRKIRLNLETLESREVPSTTPSDLAINDGPGLGHTEVISPQTTLDHIVKDAKKTEVIKGSVGSGCTDGKKAPSTVGSSGDYPYVSSNPLTSVAFSESAVLVGSKMDAVNGTFDVWYSDEHALALGVRQVIVNTASGISTTNYDVTALTSNPGAAINPAIGTTATTGDQAGTDVSGRPLAPSLYITDITTNPSSRSGDWQFGGTAIAPSAVFGTWKAFTRTVNYNSPTPTVTLTADADPARNGWNLGAGADSPPAGVASTKYGAEIRWNLNDLFNQGVLIPGHNYRFYVMVHDGDQNKSGGDAGQASYQVNYPGPPVSSQPASISGFVLNKTTGAGIGSVVVYLEDSLGNILSTTTTGNDGSYSFTGLTAGTYQLVAAPTTSWFAAGEKVGTINGILDGSDSGNLVLGNIKLTLGDSGINYDFYLLPGG